MIVFITGDQVFFSNCRLVVVIHTTPHQGESTNHNTDTHPPHTHEGPIFSRNVNLLPLSRVAISPSSVHITAITDVTVYAEHIKNVLAFKQTLVAKVTSLNTNRSDLPQFLMLSDNIDRLINEVSTTLLAALEALDHDPVCHNSVREKRDLIRDQGLFPGVGRILSFLTGTLTSDASRYINANTQNLLKLKTSQLSTIHVVNHTIHIARENAVRLQHLNKHMQA